MAVTTLSLLKCVAQAVSQKDRDKALENLKLVKETFVNVRWRICFPLSLVSILSAVVI